MIIYKITNKENGKIYIGQTVRTLAERWKNHKYDFSRVAPHCKILIAACRKYGIEAFSIEKLATASNLEELNQLEIKYIKDLNALSPAGYNIRLGGNGGGRHSAETKAKLSKANLGNTNGRGGKGIKRHSEEHKKALGDRMRGVPKNKDSIEKSAKRRRRPIVAINKNNISWFFYSAVEAEKFGFKRKQISKVLKKSRQTHGGYNWYYFNEFKQIEE